MTVVAEGDEENPSATSDAKSSVSVARAVAATTFGPATGLGAVSLACGLKVNNWTLANGKTRYCRREILRAGVPGVGGVKSRYVPIRETRRSKSIAVKAEQLPLAGVGHAVLVVVISPFVEGRGCLRRRY